MDTLYNRLQIRRERLNQAAENGKALLAKCRDGGVLEDEFTLCRLKLKQNLQALEKELYHYLSINGDQNIDEITEDQLKAEDIHTELEATSLGNKTVSTTKLPKLTLPTYSGDKLKWSEFWDRFKANVHQQSIADADKLSYLLSCLNGTALETISGLTTTDSNYSLAIEALERRFGSKDGLIDAHYTAINNLSKAEYNSVSCRSVLDSIERHLRVLEKLGEPANGNHLRAMVLGKFPEKVVHEHHLIGGEDNSVMAIRNSLHRIVTAMEKSSTLVTSSGLLPPTVSTTETLQIRTEVHPVSKSKFIRKRKQDVTTEAPPTKRVRKPCLFCKLSNHPSADCRRYRTLEARRNKLTGRCHRCLKNNHLTESCKRKIACFRCKEDHLLIFCPKSPDGENLSTSLEVKALCDVSNGFTFLQTAVANLQNPKSQTTKKTRLLLDSGSQRSYITQNAAKSLELPILKEDQLLIYTFGSSEPQKTSSPSTVINVETKRGTIRKMQVNIVPRITDRVPVATLTHKDADILADDNTTGEGIDLLVGNDYYNSFMRDNKIKIATNLYLLDTDFGWIVSGRADPEEVTDALSVVTYCQCHIPSCPYFTEPDLPLRNIDIKFLWSLESIGITDSPKATRQEEAVSHFNETVQYQNGRYLVKWPWVLYPPDLPTNFGLALGRLKSILRRSDEDTLNEYNTILKEQLELGIIESVNENSDVQDDHPLHYLPHHMIKQKGKKGRIVYDASAKMAGQKSLNECLYSGPSMLEDLTALLLKFRTSRIGLIADVEKAFLQVGLQEEDRDVTRFLWIKDVTKEPSEDNLLYLRFCRVPFGVISSPFLLTATIRHHMSQSDENLLKTIADRCYVDNLVTGADSVREAEQIYQQTRITFDQLSMNIRDWVSNEPQFMDMLPKSFKAEQTTNVKVLGLNWDVRNDILKLKVTESHFSPDTPVDTKRKVLRTLARIYDPCGFACPLVLPMKMHFQNICELKVKWDTELPKDLIESIKVTLEELKAATDIGVPRYIGIDSSKEDTTFYLHCFTDASKNAYSAVVYLKAVSQQQSTVSFLMAKSHVSQAKDKVDLKIPKLELLGFLIGSRLLKYVRDSVNLQVQKEYLWTDSLVVLAWMKSSKLLPPFVANRVSEIKRNHPQTEMCYIHTKSNPADVATRPELFKEKRELWSTGPEFLQKDESSWPANRHYDTHKTFFSVGEPLASDGQDVTVHETIPLEDDSQDMTSYETEPSYEDKPDDSTCETVSEIKRLQLQHFPDELNGKRTHLARNLDLFLDVDGVLRCRGRMTNTTWSYDMKYPILLPKNCEFTSKIIKEIHESNYHVGASHTLNIIREQYWIPQGKAQVQKLLRRCHQCTKHGGGPYKLPDTPALPPERVNYYHPFTFSGVDYCGPLYVNTATGTVKRWVALFTCLTVRAIHLEIVKDLSAEECLLALRRFAATRGIPKRMYSDNATYFKLVSEVMEKPFCIDKKIEWKFIPQLAPWHGGFYERLVALVKHCLKRTLEKHLIQDNKLLTVMKEVEAVVNSRPLTRVGTEIDHILKPADFLSLGKCLTMTPSTVDLPGEGTSTKVDLINSWKRGLKLMEEFQKMFISQYLTSLRERYHHAPKQPRIKSNRAPQVGDLVQIKSDDKNRNRWRTGKIISLFEGRDGKNRVAKVQTEDSVLTRSVGHLYPLEVDEEPLQSDVPEAEMPVHEDRITAPSPVTVTDEAMDIEVDPVVIGPDEALDTETDPVVTGPDNAMDMETASVIAGPNDAMDTDTESVVARPNEVMSPADGPTEVGSRGKRDAAIRAREKILEWTRHLLVLLK